MGHPLVIASNSEFVSRFCRQTHQCWQAIAPLSLDSGYGEARPRSCRDSKAADRVSVPHSIQGPAFQARERFFVNSE